MTRGLYLNNPACIRLSNANNWKGLSSVQKDKEFCTFVNMNYGIRALVKILRTYTYSYGLNTIRDIISRYSPASENDTESYIRIVSDDLDNPSILRLFIDRKPTYECFLLCRSICKVESGFNLTLHVFNQSVRNL